MFQIFDAHCQECGLGNWKSISVAELAVLIDDGELMKSSIKSDGVTGFLDWFEALKKKISDNNGVITTQSGERLIRII